MRWWGGQQEIGTLKTWEMLVPEAGPETMNEKNRKGFRNTGDANWHDLGLRYRSDKKERRTLYNKLNNVGTEVKY